MGSIVKLPRLRRVLPRTFYDRDTVEVARELLGKVLVSRIGGQFTGGVIVETEAYLSANDPACHAARGQTARNACMFGPPGHLYVYWIHAKHCLNAVTESSGRASAVLIRALEPLWGVETMAARRGTHVVRDLARGPARLCEALSVNKAQNGIDLTSNRDVSIHPWVDGGSVRATPRIGISQATDLPLRFFLDRNPFVSGRAADHSARPQMSSRKAVSGRWQIAEQLSQLFSQDPGRDEDNTRNNWGQLFYKVAGIGGAAPISSLCGCVRTTASRSIPGQQCGTLATLLAAWAVGRE